MTREAAMTKALAAFDQIVADRERSNITAMLADGVDPDALDAFIGEARVAMRQSRKFRADFGPVWMAARLGWNIWKRGWTGAVGDSDLQPRRL
jgi:hypothetical protein